MHQKVTLHCTLTWHLEKLLIYLPEIEQAFKKLKRKFSATYQWSYFWHELQIGEKILFLILDEQEHFVAFATVSLIYDNAHQLYAQIWDLAGKWTPFYDHIIDEFEQWAVQQGAQRLICYGRLGWKKYLMKKKFKITSMKFEKEI